MWICTSIISYYTPHIIVKEIELRIYPAARLVVEGGASESERKKYSNSKCDVREIISVASYRNFVTSRMITFLHSEIKSRYNILSYWSSPSTTRLKLNEMNEWKFHSHSLWEFSFSPFFTSRIRQITVILKRRGGG